MFVVPSPSFLNSERAKASEEAIRRGHDLTNDKARWKSVAGRPAAQPMVADVLADAGGLRHSESLCEPDVRYGAVCLHRCRQVDLRRGGACVGAVDDPDGGAALLPGSAEWREQSDPSPLDFMR